MAGIRRYITVDKKEYKLLDVYRMFHPKTAGNDSQYVNFKKRMDNRLLTKTEFTLDEIKKVIFQEPKRKRVISKKTIIQVDNKDISVFDAYLDVAITYRPDTYRRFFQRVRTNFIKKRTSFTSKEIKKMVNDATRQWVKQGPDSFILDKNPFMFWKPTSVSAENGFV